MNRFGLVSTNVQHTLHPTSLLGKKALTVALASLLAVTSPAFANSQDEEVRLLKEQLAQLSQRLEKLEAEKKAKAEKKTTHQAQAKLQHPDFKQWPHRVAFNADLRYRQEYIDEKGKDTRFRHRIRFRTGMKMTVTEDILLGFQLASGDDNPVSNNVTLDHAFSNKDIRLNKAYAKWKFTDSLTGTFGKFSNPYYRPNRNPLVWDNDLIPEGVAIKQSIKQIDMVAGWFSVEERKAEKDTQLLGFQMSHDHSFENKSKVIVAASYFNYINLKGYSPLYNGKSKNNLLDESGGYLSDYNIAELATEYQTTVFERPFKLFADYARNLAAETDEDTAWSVGFQLGKAKKPGNWQFSYAWLDLDSESVVGTFNDSDFAGGNVNSKGSIYRFQYKLNKKTSMGFNYIDSQIGKNSETVVDYDRLQVDVGWKF